MTLPIDGVWRKDSSGKQERIWIMDSIDHILSDYGDESDYKTPWEIFDKEEAEEAYQDATAVIQQVKEIILLISSYRA